MPVEQRASTEINVLGNKMSVIPGLKNNIIDFLGRRILPQKNPPKVFGNTMKQGIDPDKL